MTRHRIRVPGTGFFLTTRRGGSRRAAHGARDAHGPALTPVLAGGALAAVLSVAACKPGGRPGGTSGGQSAGGAQASGPGTPGAANPGAGQLVIGPENVVVAREGVVTTGPAISGTLTPATQATVRAQVAGSVLMTNTQVGQSVSRGQLLARLDAEALSDAVLSARSAVASAENALDIASRDLQRSKTLLDSGAIARRDYEGAERTYTGARATVENARAQLAAAQKNLSHTSITAPFAGIVSEKSVNTGDVVQPGTALFTIVDPSSMELDASVPSGQLASVRVGSDVAFGVTGYPGREFHGRVTRVSPAVDPATRQVQITVTIPNAGKTLVAGLYADGRLASQRQSGIVVPVSAVDVRLQRPAVVRLRNGKVERADVTLGLRDERAETVQIMSGVSTGDTLLVAAAQGISPGTPVRVEAQAASQLTPAGATAGSAR